MTVTQTKETGKDEPVSDNCVTCRERGFTSWDDILHFIDEIYEREKATVPFKISTHVACVFERTSRSTPVPEYELNIFSDWSTKQFATYTISGVENKEQYKEYLSKRMADMIENIPLSHTNFRLVSLFAFDFRVHRIRTRRVGGGILKERLQYFYHSRCFKVPLNDDNFCFDCCAVMFKNPKMKNTDCATKARAMAWERIHGAKPETRSKEYKEFIKSYEGLDMNRDVETFCTFYGINLDIYEYSETKHEGEDKSKFHFILAYEFRLPPEGEEPFPKMSVCLAFLGSKAHAMLMVPEKVEKTIGIKFCPECHEPIAPYNDHWHQARALESHQRIGMGAEETGSRVE